MPIPREGTYKISSVQLLHDVFSRMLKKPKRWYADIWGDAGIGFILGGLCGTAFDFLKGMYESPKGQRLSGGSNAVSNKGAFRFGPVVAAHIGSLAVLRSLVEDNICNDVLVTVTTFGGIQFIRSRDIWSAARSALYGVLLLGFLETTNAYMEAAGKVKKEKKVVGISWERGKGWELNYDD